MKKLTIIFIFVLLSVAFCACSSNAKVEENTTALTSTVAKDEADSTNLASNDSSSKVEAETQTIIDKSSKKENKIYNVENETTMPKQDVNGDVVITKGNNKVGETTETQIPTTKKETKNTTTTTKAKTKNDVIENDSSESKTESDNVHINAGDLI